MVNMTMDQLENNKFIEGPGYPKSTVRTSTFVNNSIVSGNNPLPITDVSNLVPENYDSIELTYITTGNGIGEIGTVIYKLSTDTVATLTLVYDINDQLSTVTKT